MPNIQVKLRRGTTAQHAGFTGAEGEVTVDTDKDTVVVHDGSTAGGHELRKKSDTIAGSEIDNDAVDTAQIAANAVTSTEIAANAVDTAQIAANAVTSTEIADDAVTPAKLDDTQAYTVSGLISDGANILINNTAATGAGIRFDKTDNASPDGQIDLIVDGNGHLNITAPEKSTNTILMVLKNNNVLNLPNIPTSSAGLASGDVWSNSGVLNIVP